MPDDNSTVSLPWHKWRLEDYRVFRDSLTNEQMGALFFAIMNTAETGDVVDVPGEIKVAYRLCVQQVLAARTAYIHRCDVNAQNGKKGGDQKAANARNKEAEQATFTPPTKTEFRKYAKELQQHDEYLVFTNAALDEFHEELSAAHWKIGNVKIESEDALCAALDARFSVNTPMNLPPQTVWGFFKRVFQEIGEDYEAFDRAWTLFRDNHSREAGCWTVGGTTYDKPVEVIQAILANASNT